MKCQGCGIPLDYEGLCGRCDDIAHDHYYDTIAEADDGYYDF